MRMRRPAVADIVERLHNSCAHLCHQCDRENAYAVGIEAADEIDRLRALIREWNEANNFGSLHGDELTAAVDRLNAAEQALIEEARRG